MAWKITFDKEISTKKALLDEEKLRGLSPKEREEWKRAGVRLTGNNSPVLPPASISPNII